MSTSGPPHTWSVESVCPFHISVFAQLINKCRFLDNVFEGRSETSVTSVEFSKGLKTSLSLNKDKKSACYTIRWGSNGTHLGCSDPPICSSDCRQVWHKGSNRKDVILHNLSYLLEAGVPHSWRYPPPPPPCKSASPHNAECIHRLSLHFTPRTDSIPLIGSSFRAFQGLFVYANVASLLRELATGAGSLISARQV